MAAITLEELLKEVGVCPEKLNECISDDHLLKIALFLISWRTVAPHLALEPDVIELEGKSEQEKRLKTLKMWKGKFGFRATYRKLVEVLLSLTMADIAEKVCHLLKGITVFVLHVQFYHDLYKMCPLNKLNEVVACKSLLSSKL